MSSAVHVGWFGRTFGLAMTPAAWLNVAGAAGWLVGLAVIASYAAAWTTGEAILAVGAWLLVLGLAARDAVRDMFGPVFFYEVVRLGRRRLTRVLRLLYVASVSAILVLMYVSWLEQIGYWEAGKNLVSTQKQSQFATEFFQIFVILQYAVVVAMTPVYVSGSIAVEKERKTLEFLLATDLRNREIVFGKFAARVVNVLMFVFAGLPVLAVLQLFGGIDPNLLLTAFAATVLTVVGLAAVGVWLSTMLRRSRDAIVLTYLLYIVYMIGSTVAAYIAIILKMTGVTGVWVDSVSLFGYSLSLPDVLLASAAGNAFWHVILLNAPAAFGTNPTDALRVFSEFWVLVSVVALAWSIAAVRRVALAQSYGPSVLPGRKKRAKRAAADAAAAVPAAEKPDEAVARRKASRRRAADRFPDMGDNPVFWKEVFVDAGFRGGWIWRVIAILVLVLVFLPLGPMAYFTFFETRGWRASWNFAQQWNEFTEEINGWARVVTGILATLIFFAAAIRGAGAVSGEKDRDTWISLIGTPLSADSILWGKWWGCVLGLRKSYLAVAAVWAIGLATGSIHPLAIPLSALALMLFVSAFTWAGLYCSMRAANSLNASIQAFFLALFMAGGFWALLALFCGLPLSALGIRGDWVKDAAHVGLGCTPPFVVGSLPFRSAHVDDMRPLDFQMSDGLGFWSVVVGLGVWACVNGLLAKLCLDRFRRATNRIPVYLKAELAMREEYRRKAAAAGVASAAPAADNPPP